MAPHVGGDPAPDLVDRLDDARIVQGGGMEAELAQRALAEAVDGGDHGLVLLQRRGRKPRSHARIADRVARAPQDLRSGVRFALQGLEVVHVEQGFSQAQAAAQAFAQLLGRSDGEGDRAQVGERDAALEQQAQQQRHQGEGLAGAGAGFDQVHAGEGQGESNVGCWRGGGAGPGLRRALARALRSLPHPSPLPHCGRGSSALHSGRLFTAWCCALRAHGAGSSASNTCCATARKRTAHGASKRANRPSGRNASCSHGSSQSRLARPKGWNAVDAVVRQAA